jgi:uncharacterized protein YecE (DUF72 family)
MVPLINADRFAGFVAGFPYSFRDTPLGRDYVEQLQAVLGGPSLQLDFRNPSWGHEEAYAWMRARGLGFVCVDEPQLPGLLPPIALATSSTVLIRLHGRNQESWWGGNTTTRYDYNYTMEELRELWMRYRDLVEQSLRQGTSIHFIFQNYWQAQSVKNALQWKILVHNELQTSQKNSLLFL